MERRQRKQSKENTVFQSVVEDSYMDFITLVRASYSSRFAAFAEPQKEPIVPTAKASLKSPEDEGLLSDIKCEEVPAAI